MHLLLYHATPDSLINESVFIDANRIGLSTGKVIRNSMIWVKSQTVFAADAIKIPDSIKQASRAGKWLMSGLSEMHAHIPYYIQRKAYAEQVLMLFVECQGKLCHFDRG